MNYKYKIVKIDELLNKVIKSSNEIIDCCHDTLSKQNNFLLTYDELYSILDKRNKFKLLKQRYNKILLDNNYMKICLYEELCNDDILLDLNKLDNIINSNYRFYAIYYQIRDYIYDLLGFISLCFIIFELFFILELY